MKKNTTFWNHGEHPIFITAHNPNYAFGLPKDDLRAHGLKPSFTETHYYIGPGQGIDLSIIHGFTDERPKSKKRVEK